MTTPIYDDNTLFTQTAGRLYHRSVGRVYDSHGRPLAPPDGPERRLTLDIVDSQIRLRFPGEIFEQWPQTLEGWTGMVRFIIAKGLHSRLGDGVSPSDNWGTPIDLASQFTPPYWGPLVTEELARQGFQHLGTPVRLRPPRRTNNSVVRSDRFAAG